jgi:Arc/MetJ-type ribon-helix-helix transcriptional regulator
MVQKSNKSVTKRIPITLTAKQVERVNELVGYLGTTQSDVIRYIVTNWLDEHR